MVKCGQAKSSHMLQTRGGDVGWMDGESITTSACDTLSVRGWRPTPRNVQRRRLKRTSSEQEQEAKQEVLHEIWNVYKDGC